MINSQVMKNTNIKKANSELVPDENLNLLSFFERNADFLAYIIIGLTLLMGLCLFNVRVDEGGDDSTYITRAIDLIASGTYPSYQGPLYPIFLAAIIGVFGAKLLVLKISSLVLICLSQYVFYRMLKGHVNIRLVLMVMGIMSINSYFLFFGSMTYSEPLFMVVEYVFLAFLLRYENQDMDNNVVKNIVGSLPSAIFAVLAYLIRTVGLGFGIVGVVYLCLRKRYAKAAMFLGSMIVMMLVWTGIKAVIWGDVKSDNSQIESLMQVHPYDVEQGQETLSGYLGRLVDNSNLYISKHLMRIVGFRSSTDRATNPMVTILVYLLFVFGAFQSWKNNRSVLLMALSTVTMLGITFVVLQPLWDQVRLIIPYVATALVVVLYGIYQMAKKVAGKKAHLVVVALVALSSLMSFGQSVEKMNFKTLRENFSGDILYGYSTDWYNYLKVCQVVYDQLPEGSYVACRKPNMARIYSGGHKFYGIYNFTTEDADVLADDLRSRGVTHIIAASLRRDPMIPKDQIINTIHRYMHFILKKYPQAFTQVGICGTEDNEPTYLFAVNYDVIDKARAAMKQNEAVEGQQE